MAIAPPPIDPLIRPPTDPDQEPDFVTRHGRLILMLIGVLFCLAAIPLMATGHPLAGETLTWTGIGAVVVAILLARLRRLRWRDFEAELGSFDEPRSGDVTE